MERTVPIEWQGRTIDAADPAPIRRATFDLSPTTIRATERAAAAVEANGRRDDAATEIAGRLLLRAEGLSSSAIEGLHATAASVALAEEGAGGDETANWVADNLAVIDHALATPPPLTTGTLLQWHTRLMRHSPTLARDHIGVWRPVVGWVGGINPLVAAHVAAPPSHIAPAMRDLVAFTNRDDLDPVTIAAVAHAQFETIHPFADGNGRIGRVLTGWTLATMLGVAVPPPASTAFARDIGGYLSGLTLYRQGHVDTWVRWFANAIGGAAERTGVLLDQVSAVQATWRTTTAGLRSDSAARTALDVLARHPVVSASLLADALDVTTTTARTALGQLARLGIVTELGSFSAGPGRPTTWWAARELLDLLG